MKPEEMLRVAIEQAKIGAMEGGIPIGAALFSQNGKLLGKGRNRRVQWNDPAIHAETDAFRNAGRQVDYSSAIMATTLSPCWYCSGLIRQFRIGTVIIGENSNFSVAEDWLLSNNVKIILIRSHECEAILKKFIADFPYLWNEDIGEN